MPIFSDARPSLYSGRLVRGIFRTHVRAYFPDAVRAVDIYLGRQSGDFYLALVACFFIRNLRLAWIACFFIRNLRFACIACFFIRNLRFACIACFVFLNEEYLIARVDFIAPCGGTKEWGRRDLRIPPSPPSGLPPFQPWGIAAAGY